MWQLGPFRLDAQRRQLSRDDREVSLQRRPTDLLVFLIVHRGRVVSRDELVEEVWNAVRVSAGAIDQAIYEVRSALGDLERPSEQRWIRTVRGRGFRFDGPVVQAGSVFDASDGLTFVGRIDVAHRLAGEIQAASRGGGSAHVIRGSAGMGKTRLVQEVVRMSPGPRLHVIQCLPEAPAYSLVDELAAELSGSADDAPGRVGEQAEGAAYRRATRLRRLLEEAAGDSSRLIVIEDVHWADGPSIGVLESIVPLVSSMRVALVLTTRDDETGFFRLSRLLGLSFVRSEVLKPLGIADVFVLTESILGRPPSPDLAGGILERSLGIALFVRELAEYYASHGGLPDTTATGAASIFDVRFAALGDADRRRLAISALEGASFDLGLIQAALASSGEGAGRDWIERAVRERIIRRSVAEPSRYEFVHALMRDVAASGLSPMERATWHTRLGRALAERHPDPDRRILSDIARHLEAGDLVGDQTDVSLHFSTLAARRAASDLAWRDVRLHANHALGWIDGLPAGPDRDARELELVLLSASATSCEADRAEKTEVLLARARHLLDRSPDPEHEACLCSHELAQARAEGDHARAREAIERAERLEVLGPVPALWRWGLSVLGGRLDEALPRVPPLREAGQVMSLTQSTARDPWIEVQVYSAFAFLLSGRDATGVRRLADARRRAKARDDARNLVWVCFFGSLFHELRRDWSAAREYAREIDVLCESHGLSAWWGSGAGFTFWFSRQRRANPDIEIAPTARIVAERARSRGASFRSVLYLLSGRISLEAGDSRQARATLEDAHAFCESTDERLLLAEISRALGRLEEREGDPIAAGNRFRAAASEARKSGNALFELRALCDLARRGDLRSDERRRLSSLSELDVPEADRWRITCVEQAGRAEATA